MAKKQTHVSPMMAVFIVAALIIGLLLGMTLVNKPQTSTSEAFENVDQMNATYDRMVQKAVETNQLGSSGGSLPNGFKQCYDECRRDGYPGAVCFFNCLH